MALLLHPLTPISVGQQIFTQISCRNRFRLQVQAASFHTHPPTELKPFWHPIQSSAFGDFELLRFCTHGAEYFIIFKGRGE